MGELGESHIGPNVIPKVNVMADVHGTRIFPSLKSLKLSISGEDCVPSAVALLQPSLTSIQLTTSSQTQSVLPILKRLELCDGIDELRLSVQRYPSHPDVVRTLCNTLAAMKVLREVSITTRVCLHPLIWVALQRIPSLRVIRGVTLGRKPMSSEAAMLSFEVHTPPLTTIEATIPYPSAISLFKGLVPETLRVITLDLTEVPGGLGSCGELIQLITTQTQSLNALVLVFRAAESLRAVNFANVLKLKELQTLNLQTEVATAMTDDDFANLTTSLPLLVRLGISFHPFQSSDPPSATLYTISHVAKNCRSIKSLALYVDTRKHTLSDDVSLYAVFSKTSEKINFGLLEVHDPPRLARNLAWITKDCDPVILADWSYIKPENLSTAQLARARGISSKWKGVQQQVVDLRQFVRGVESASAMSRNEMGDVRLR